MSTRGVIVLLAATFAFAQNQPVSVMGTVGGISGNRVYILAGGDRHVTLSADTRTEVWKGKVFHDLSPVEAGDNVIARYRADTSGNLVAESIVLNIAAFDAVVTKVNGTRFEVLTNPNADPLSAYRKENKTIEVDADTLFDASAREDLQPGRNVHVVGLGLKNGEVRATRVTVYERNGQVRLRPNAVIVSPDGSRRQ